MRKIHITACTAAMLAVASASIARADQSSEQDKHFVKDAASGGMVEVRLGQYASDNASSDAVKKFGEHMVGDHSKANDKLKEVASQQGIDVPAKLSKDDQKTLGKLEQLKGETFDKQYSQGMVDDHVKDIAGFEKEIKDGTNPAIKAFAEETLPTLKHHLEMARKLAGQS